MISNKNYRFFLIPYLTITCGLYHMVYWGRFGLNGLSLVSFEDILKSAIGSFSGAFVVALFGYLITSKLIFRNKNKSVEQGQTLTKNKLKKVAVWTVFWTVIFIFKNIIIKETSNNGTSIAIALSFILRECVNVNFLFAADFYPRYNKDLLLLLISFPLFSYGKALDESNLIFNNISFKYMLIKSNDHDCTLNVSDTLKFLGNKDDLFIFENMNNSKTLFLKSDTILLRLNK